MIKRITLRTRRRTATGTSVVLGLLLALLAIAFLQSPLGTTRATAATSGDCPGGSTSGQASSSCSNLHNAQLRTQRYFPGMLYRGDSRTPYTLFNTGFGARGGNNDLVAHVQGDRAGNSNYISTTGTLGVAMPFAQSQGLRNLESAARIRCQQIQAANNARRGWVSRIFPSNCNGTQVVAAESYVYLIDPHLARNALYVPDQIRGNANLYNHYASQDEWAFVHRIPREAIQGVRVYRMTARTNNGLIDTRSITFAYDRFIINPHYAQVTINYNPSSDGSSNFVYSSNLNIPGLPANPYTRGCSAITRCRGGGN
ncbi:hypothetical protein [Streptomyces sp. NPDC047061]|uniref:hypothetical protein n=1 Tax=Streptomyces sp. NPDC047061 TaxID=3154605 RepID=UPI0033C4D2B9